MSTKQDLNYKGADQSTGAKVATRYTGQGNSTVNSYPVTVTDAASSNLTAYAIGEAPITTTGPIYQVPDPQAGVSNPSWVRVDTTSGVVGVVLPLHPYDGMSVTISDLAGTAGTHNIDVGTSNTTTDLYESYPSNGTFIGPSGSTALNANGVSVTYRYIAGSPGRWKITGIN